MTLLQKASFIAAFLPIPVLIAAITMVGVEGVATSLWVKAALFSGFLICLGVYLNRALRKSVTNRVVLDVRPSLISAGEGDDFAVGFSSSTHFIASTEKFQEAVSGIVYRDPRLHGKAVMLRESAHVRIWPGELTLTAQEFDFIVAAFEAEFVEPAFEVLSPDQGVIPSDNCDGLAVAPAPRHHNNDG